MYSTIIVCLLIYMFHVILRLLKKRRVDRRMADKQIKFYMNTAEYNKAEKNAKEVGLSVNQYAKRLAVDVTSIDSKEDREVMDTISEYILEIQRTKAELRKIGSNLNQIARAKNLELYYDSTSHDTASFGRDRNPDLEIALFVKSGEEAKAFNRLADEMGKIRSRLEKFEEKMEKGAQE